MKGLYRKLKKVYQHHSYHGKKLDKHQASRQRQKITEDLK